MAKRLMAVAGSLPSAAAVTHLASAALDPHHRAILDGLNGRLDPEVFEQCAVELVQAVFPGVVPIRGGRDDGFDGAVADGSSQEPSPLVVTTGAELVGNLKKNLDSAQRKGWNPRRATFATSRRITPATRRELFDAARGREVILIQTFDRDWFASRLYHEPQWCKRLLGVTGRPHALSVFPVQRRPVLGDDVLGREREKQWLLEQRGDCVLVGEPGSGKTFLLRALALEGRALFLVDENREQIANDLRSLKPEAVIVDDAHVHENAIETLTQLRQEVRADFRIIATCWPGETGRTASMLQVGRSSVLTLDLIDADTMIEIIKSAGIRGPNELLYVIRSQAGGRPGLAITLAHLCLVGDIRAATSGEGLVDTIAPDLDRVLEMDSMRLLAPFALGGDAGARQEDIARQLDVPLFEVSRALATLGAAGVVRDSGGAITVEPAPMRWVLVRRVFFDGPGSLPVDRFLTAVRSRTDALKTLIGARARGANVPDLERSLEEAGSARLWAAYASVDPDTTRFALARHPEIIEVLAEPALAHLPEKVIPMLLSRVHENCSVGAAMKSGLRPLEQWIRYGSSAGVQGAIERRETLLRCAEAWWRQSRNSDVVVGVACLALNPDFIFVTRDPGIGTHVTISKATFSADDINRLAASWPTVMAVVGEATDVPWTKLLELLTAWRNARLSVEDRARDAAIQFLSRALRDLGVASRQLPGVQHRIAGIAKGVDVAVETRLDSDFECLFPQDPYDAEDVDQEVERLDENARQLAERWRSRSADDLANLLGRHETEARRAGITHPRLTPRFCLTLAKDCVDPAAFAKTLMRARLPVDLVESFLGEALRSSGSAWSIVSHCLDDSLYVAMSVKLAVCGRDAPLEMVRSALAKVDQAPRLLEHYCVTGEVSPAALSEALRFPDASTAVSAAIGNWKASRRSRSEVPLDESWRRAFLQSAEIDVSPLDGYWTGEILARIAHRRSGRRLPPMA